MEKNLTSGSVLKNIVYFSLPYLLSYFLQTLYGMADLFIIGQFEGVAGTTAVSIGSQVMHMLTVMIVGLAMGTTVSIGQAIGANDKRRAANAIGNTVTLFAVVAAGMFAILLLLVNPILQVMSTPQEAEAGTRIYLTICFVGIPFIIAYNVIRSIFRGLGDSKSPMYFIAIACVINIALDYLFMGAFHMGAAGAALGTTLSQAVSVVISLFMIRKKKMGIALKKQNLRPKRRVMGQILNIGVPVALQDGFIQIAFLVITIIANRRGLNQAAAVGIVEKIISFLFLVPSSMLSSVSALAAQNIGAGKHDRARETLHYALLIAGGFGIFIAILIQFIASPVVGVFTSDQTVIAFGSQYICGYIFDCFFAGIHFCFSGYFCAYGKSGISFFHNIVAILCVRIPGAYLTSKWFPQTLFPIGIATACGSLLSALICVAAFVRLKQHKRLQNVQTADSTVRVSKKHRSDVR